MTKTLTIFLIFLVTTVISAPRKKYNTRKSDYNLSNFDEVYDQRQNGTENYRIDLSKVLLVWTPPETLIQAALLTDPQFFEGEYPDVEEVLTNSPEKPQDLLIKPETEKPLNLNITETTVPKTHPEPKRRFRLPGFMRPFVQN